MIVGLRRLVFAGVCVVTGVFGDDCFDLDCLEVVGVDGLETDGLRLLIFKT